jgi:lysozyme
LTQNSPPPEAPKGKFGALAALVGVGAAALLVPLVQQWEGREHQAYRDIVGVLTICDGDTKDVRPGQVATDAECDARLERQLIAHAKPVITCVPTLKDKPNALAASSSLAYNIGPAAFCRSTAARRFRANRWREGCDSFLAWRFAGGKEIRGLKRRREAERRICLRDAG